MKGFTEKDGVLGIIFANNLIYKWQKFQPSQTSPSVFPLEIAYLVQKLWNFWYQVKILVFLHHLQKEWVLFYLKWAWNECLHLRTSEISIDMGRRIVQCDYASSRVDSLRTHLKTHSEEKPHKCNQCDLQFSLPHHLRRHMKTHSGEKQHKCNQCGFASVQGSDLVRHLKMHSGEKTHKCTHCGFATVWAYSMRKHLKTHSAAR